MIRVPVSVTVRRANDMANEILAVELDSRGPTVRIATGGFRGDSVSERSVSSRQFARWVQALSDVELTPAAQGDLICDAEETEIEVTLGSASSKYRWAGDGPAEWRQIAMIAEEILKSAGIRDDGKGD